MCNRKGGGPVRLIDLEVRARGKGLLGFEDIDKRMNTSTVNEKVLLNVLGLSTKE